MTVGNYEVVNAEIGGIVTNDDSDVFTGTYYPGQDVEIEGTFTGATDQEDDYSYAAYFASPNFANPDYTFFLDGDNDQRVGTTLSNLGSIPVDVPYDLSWEVTIVPFTGADPSFPVDEALLGDADFVGYDGGEFDDDGERSVTSDLINIQSATNGLLTINVSKTSNGLSPAGTELRVLYSTDGFATSTQVGTDISLNDDLSEDIEIDLSSETGIVSSSTQFRVYQLNNSGQDLDMWDISTLSVSTGGTVPADLDPIDYLSNSAFVDIDAPVVVLDPVDVPADLIFPGDEIDLTYNIVNGEFPAGTELTAVFEPFGGNPFMVGTSSLITPGDTEDHPITISTPVVEGDLNYQIRLTTENSFEDEVNSNTITYPIYETGVTIDDVTSNSGVSDGGLDVIYAGNTITVAYTIDGSVGTGGELFLEVYDYSVDVDDYVVISSATGADIDGTIDGTLPTGIDYDDDGDEDPFIRLRIGNGILAQPGTFEFAENENGDDANGVDPFDEGFFDQLVGNFPVDPSDGSYDNFIGSGERSVSTIPFDFTFGGNVEFSFSDAGNYVADQTLYLQASIDGGTSWTTFGEEDYTGGGVSFDELLPKTLWSSATSFRVIYNEDGASEEFENELDFGSMTLQSIAATSGSSDERNISDQFSKPTVSLEVLDSYAFTTGEQLTIEYTTSGTFPTNTAFAIVLEGDDEETVIGEATGTGLTSVDVTIPAFAFSDNPDDTEDIYDELKVVAFDQSINTSYIPDEDIDLDDDDFFLVIEGTNDDDGSYLFDEAGDRSLLTQAFDLSGATSVEVEFYFEDDGDIDPTDNILTIPVFQVSIDGGATFTDVAVEEDGMLGDGYLFNDDTYTADIPSGLITAATHFRWYQPLNLGEDEMSGLLKIL